MKVVILNQEFSGKQMAIVVALVLLFPILSMVSTGTHETNVAGETSE